MVFLSDFTIATINLKELLDVLRHATFLYRYDKKALYGRNRCYIFFKNAHPKPSRFSAPAVEKQFFIFCLALTTFRRDPRSAPRHSTVVVSPPVKRLRS